jgi:hypothetical protein
MSVPRIGRYAPGLDPLAFAEPPANVEPAAVPLTAEDGARSQGVLYSNGSEQTAVCVIHPRADVSRHYTIPPLVESVRWLSWVMHRGRVRSGFVVRG